MPRKTHSGRRLKRRSTRRTRCRSRASDVPSTFPRFYVKPDNQAAAELIAHHYCIDTLVGLPLDLDSLLLRWPYNSFDPGAVTAFLPRLLDHLHLQQPRSTHA